MKNLGRYEYRELEDLLNSGFRIVEYSEGCLIDNMLISDGKTTIVALETPLNCWSSCYTLYEGSMNECDELWDSKVQNAKGLIEE